MNASIPRPLFKSAEFWALSEHGRMVLRILWKRGLEQTWGTETAHGREVLLRELQSRGLFLGAAGPVAFDELVEAFVAAGVFEESDERLALPLLSGDRPAGEKSAVATRKERQRQLDELFPDRVEKRRAERARGTPKAVTSSVTESGVTPRDGHVPSHVTGSLPSGEGVGEEDEEDIRSSSSSSSEIPDARAPVPANESHAPPSRVESRAESRPPVTPESQAPVTPTRTAARVLLEDSRGTVSLAPRAVCDAFDAELGAELPTFTTDDVAEVAAFVVDRRRLIDAFAGYASLAGDVKRTGSVTLAMLRGKARSDGRHEFAPLLDLRERARAWRAAEVAAAAQRERASRDLPKPPGEARPPPAKAGSLLQGYQQRRTAG